MQEKEQRQLSQWTKSKISWRKTSRWNKALVLLTAVVAVSNAGYTRYASKQFDVMSKQLEEMAAARQQTNTIAQAAVDQAKAAKDQAEIARSAMDASQKSFATSFAENIKTSHLDQRAWISVDPVIARLTEGEKIQFEARIHNTGRTPAINSRICTFSHHFIPDNGRDHPYPCNYEPQLPIGPVMPNAIVVHNFNTEFDVWVKEKEMYTTPFGQNKLALFTTGQFWYEDVFGCERWVKFCRYFDGPTGRLLPCVRPFRDETDDANTCHKADHESEHAPSHLP